MEAAGTAERNALMSSVEEAVSDMGPSWKNI